MEFCYSFLVLFFRIEATFSKLNSSNIVGPSLEKIQTVFLLVPQQGQLMCVQFAKPLWPANVEAVFVKCLVNTTCTYTDKCMKSHTVNVNASIQSGVSACFAFMRNHVCRQICLQPQQIVGKYICHDEY